MRYDTVLIKVLPYLSITLLHAIVGGLGFVPNAFCDSEEKPILLESISLDRQRPPPEPGVETVEIRSSRPFLFVTYTLNDPNRIIIDPVEPVSSESVPEHGVLGGDVVYAFRLIWNGQANSPRPLDYIELELSEPAQHRVEKSDWGWAVQVRAKALDLPQEIRASSILPATGQAVPNEAPDLFTKLGNDQEIWDFRRSLNFGLIRNRSVRVARQEVELAQAKVREARRALYPNASVRFNWTEGTASNVDFREYQAGLQVEHPLYQSGRLMQTYRQSLINLQVAEKRHAKAKADYTLELAQEYYQWIGAKESLAAQEDLVERAETFLKNVRTRFDEKLVTRLEVLNVESQLNQAKFQKLTAQNDLTLARMKFLAKLGLSPQAVVHVPDRFDPPSLTPIDLEEALRLSVQYRADIQINSLLVEFHEYEERIAKAKMDWKVDLSGFIGASAAAFETEPLDSGEDWFVGIKASRAWGVHSTSASVTRTKTSPRLGQTTRTDSLVYSTEMGIVDQLQGLTEIKQAQVNLEKARRDLEEVKQSVFQEVEEAYIGYQKAKLQLEYATQRIEFRKEQVKILEAQASLNEALPSQVLEAIMKLTDEKVAQAQALTNYYVALAKLNKAIGLPGHYGG